MSEHIIEVEYDTFNGTYTQKRHEEIVRCRDCAYCEKGRDGWHVCNRWNEPLIFADGDGFCAWGERRDA